MVNLQKAIEHGNWHECTVSNHRSILNFDIRILDFQQFNIDEVDDRHKIHYSLDPKNGCFYLICVEIINRGVSKAEFTDICDFIYLVDQNGFRYEIIKDYQLCRYSKFAVAKGLDRDNVYRPKIKRIGAFAFYLPLLEHQIYSITTNTKQITPITERNEILPPAKKNGAINIQYAIESMSWFRSAPRHNKTFGKSKRFDIRLISFEIFVSDKLIPDQLRSEFDINNGKFQVMEFEIVNLEKEEVWSSDISDDIVLVNDLGQKFTRIYDEHIFGIAEGLFASLLYLDRVQLIPKIKGRGAFLYFLPTDDYDYTVVNIAENFIER